MNTGKLVFSVTVALAYLFIFNTSGFWAKVSMAAPPDDIGEEGGNNMSVPAVLTNSGSGNIAAFWNPPPEAGHLCVHYSYGCDKPEIADHFSYPNTSCVEVLMVPQDELACYTAEACTAVGGKCEGYEVSRIYWQKEAFNDWSSDQNAIEGSIEAAFVDWGDALEAVSWKVSSKIRVETQPYASTFPGFIGDDGILGPCYAKALYAGEDPFLTCKKGFQMWHVSGQGITEHWGIRTTEEAVPYTYDSPYQIIYAGTAKLNLAKMEAATAECPSTGGGEEEGEVTIMQSEPPALITWTVDPGSNGAWEGACTWRDASYSIELSVGGKYVYGYNWDMKTLNLDSICPGWQKTGWWRLTFYTPGPNPSINFIDANTPVSAPPAAPAQIRDLTRPPFVTSTAQYVPSVSELYAPVVDPANNLTYIDICIVEGGGGGDTLDAQMPEHGGGVKGGSGGKPGGSGGRIKIR